MKTLTITLISFGSVLAVFFIGLSMFVASFTVRDTPKTADVIIVPGAKAYRRGQFNPCLYGRVEKAAQLLEADQAPFVILSGGNDYADSKNEAVAMKAMALELGVPEEKIILEPAATSSYENITLSEQIMDDWGFKTAILVSEPFHLARVSLVAKKQGIEHTTSPAYDSPCWQRWRYLSRFFLREPIVLVAYFGLGYI